MVKNVMNKIKTNQQKQTKNPPNLILSILDIKPTWGPFLLFNDGIFRIFSDIPNGDIFALATHKGFIDDIMDYSTLYEGFDVIAPSNSLRLSKPEDAYVAIGKKGMHCLLRNVSTRYLFIVQILQLSKHNTILLQ